MPAGLSILIGNKLQKFKNLSAQSDPKIHTVLEIAENFIVRIDPELVQRLGIREGDIVSQVEDGIGRITLIFKDTKNKVVGNSQETNNWDHGE